MRRFLELLSQRGCPQLAPTEFERRVGEGAWRALRAERVLVDLPPPATYPCGGWEGDGCPREVLHEPSVHHPTQPYVAVCGNDVPECSSLRLSAEDLRRVGVSLPALARLLADRYGVRHPAAPALSDLPGVQQLGHAVDGRFLAFSARPGLRSARLFLRTTRERAALLVPTRCGLSHELLERHGPGERVELRVLEDELAVRDGHIARIRGSDVPGEATRIVVDQEGERPLDETGYAALCARLDQLDLFVDLTAPLDGDHVRARTRETDGTFRESALTRVQAEALLELASHPGPVRPARLRTLVDAGIQAKVRYVERIRSAVDVRLGRRRWRFVNAVSGDIPEAKAFAFSGAADLEYALIHAGPR